MSKDKGCGCKSDCGCVLSGPIGPKGDRGDNGANGTNGVSVIAAFVSNGITPIGDTIYPVNTLVEQLSDLSYINAGIITIPEMVWVDIVPENGWTTVDAKYAIHNGFIYFRGRGNYGVATSDVFCTLSIGNTVTLFSSAATNDLDVGNAKMATFQINIAGEVNVGSASSILGGTLVLLDSVSPISIR